MQMTHFGQGYLVEYLKYRFLLPIGSIGDVSRQKSQFPDDEELIALETQILEDSDEALKGNGCLCRRRPREDAHTANNVVCNLAHQTPDVSPSKQDELHLQAGKLLSITPDSSQEHAMLTARRRNFIRYQPCNTAPVAGIRKKNRTNATFHSDLNVYL